MNKQIKYGAIISYAGILINIIMGLLYTPWMIRSIGKSDYGLYTLAMSVIGIFVFDFGLGQAVTRFAAKYVSEERQDKVNQFMGLVYKLYIIADIIIFLVLLCVFFFLPSIYQGLTPEEIEKFKIVYAVAASFSVLSFPFIPLNGVISAYELFIPLKACDLFHKFLTVALMSGCLLMGYGLYALVIVNSIAGIVMIIIKIIVLKKKTPVKIEWNFWNKDLLKEIFSFSIWVTVAALAQRLCLNVCPSILGYAADSQSIAIFGIAMTLEGYVYSFASAINGLFLPKVTRLDTSGAPDDVLNLMIRVGRIQIYILGLIVLGLVCTGQNFINAWLGVGYEQVYVCALLMIAPSFIGLAQSIASTAVVVQNKVKKSARISVIKAVTNIVLAYPLTLLWGVYGISLSIFLSYSISLVQYNILYNNEMNINIKSFFRETYGKLIMPLILSVVLCFPVNYILVSFSWINFGIKVLLFLIIYSALMYFMGMNEEEKSLILSPIKRIIRRR